MADNKQLTTKDFFQRDVVKKKFQEMLGKRAPSFITSVLQIASSNKMLAKADPTSIYQAAALAATLDLPLNNNLGFAYIVPYNNKQPDGTWQVQAQFQLSYRGYVQLAMRSGQFKTISSTKITEGQIVSNDPLKGYEFDFSVQSEKVIGYAAYFELINGFSKTLYMTVEELEKHGKRFSKTYQKGYGLWKDDFESMAKKTVLKMLLSKFAPLSVDMQKAVVSDSAVIKDAENNEVEYVDNEDSGLVDYKEVTDEEEQKIEKGMVDFINKCEDIKELKANEDFYQTKAEKEAYKNRLEELQSKKVKDKKDGIKGKGKAKSIKMP